MLGLYIYGSVEVAGNLKVDHLHVRINCVQKLPYTGGVLLINGNGLTLNEGRGSQVGNLIEIP